MINKIRAILLKHGYRYTYNPTSCSYKINYKAPFKGEFELSATIICGSDSYYTMVELPPSFNIDDSNIERFRTAYARTVIVGERIWVTSSSTVAKHCMSPLHLINIFSEEFQKLYKYNNVERGIDNE